MKKTFFLFLGIYIFLFAWRWEVLNKPLTVDYNNGFLEGVILEEPEILGNRQSFEIEGIQIITKRYPEYHYGDQIKVKIQNSKVPLRSRSEASKTTTQNSKLSQKSHSELVSESQTIFYPKIELINESSGNKFLKSIYDLRGKIVEIYQKVLQVREAGLLAGIVLGVKSNLPYEFNQALRSTGTIHVVVASGQNISIFTGFLFFFFKAWIGRRKALLFSILGALFYMAISGFQAPIVRAGIMAMMAFLAQILGRQKWGAYGLGITVLLMLLINPFYLKDLGFQLSVLATSGLLFIQPLFLPRRHLGNLTRGHLGGLDRIFSVPLLGEALSTTISAQLAVLPLIFYHFGSISLLSPIVNALILWVIPIVMGGGIILAVLGLIFLPLAQLLAYFIYALLWYFSEVVMWFNNLGWGQLLVESPSLFLVLGYYLILGGIIVRLKLLKKLSIK